MDAATLRVLQDVLLTLAIAGERDDDLSAVHVAHAVHQLVVASGVDSGVFLNHLQYKVEEHAKKTTVTVVPA